MSTKFSFFLSRQVTKFLCNFNATRLNVKLPPKATRLDGEVSVSQQSLQSKNGSGSWLTIWCNVSFGDKLQDVGSERPAKVAKNKVVPDVDTDKVGGIEGRSMPPMPSHLGWKSEECRNLGIGLLNLLVLNVFDRYQWRYLYRQRLLHICQQIRTILAESGNINLNLAQACCISKIICDCSSCNCSCTFTLFVPLQVIIPVPSVNTLSNLMPSASCGFPILPVTKVAMILMLAIDKGWYWYKCWWWDWWYFSANQSNSIPCT